MHPSENSISAEKNSIVTQGDNCGTDKKRKRSSDVEFQNDDFDSAEANDRMVSTDRDSVFVREALDSPSSNHSLYLSNRTTAATQKASSGLVGTGIVSSTMSSDNFEESHPSPNSESSSTRKRRIPPGPGLKWCAGGSGGGGRWVDARDEALFAAENVEKISTPKKSKPEDSQSAQVPAQAPKPLSIRPKHRVIGNGIFISGGRVMMNDSASGESKITVCTFCGRPFISAHALDVHLSRNQVMIIEFNNFSRFLPDTNRL